MGRRFPVRFDRVLLAAGVVVAVLALVAGAEPRVQRRDPPPADAQQTAGARTAARNDGDAPDSAPGTPSAARCVVPDVPIPHTPGCEREESYPDCRWRVPHPAVAGYLYTRWRHTTHEHWWGRPALVSRVLAVAREYARQYPGEKLAVGDLDAEGPRHETHDRGIDLDLYLPGMMAAENEGKGVYPNNYAHRPRLGVRAMRGRVETLARILAACTEGRIRIYYNDPVVTRRFLRWYRRRDFEAPLGRPMRRHNDLHRFHFHVRIDPDLEPLPFAEDSR